MPTQDDHAHKFEYLMPHGSPFDGEDLRSLYRALAGSPSRVDEAGEQFLTDFMPDTCGQTGALIDDWARLLGLPGALEADEWATYTDAEKQAAIVAKLNWRGQVNIDDLQVTMELLFDDAGVELRHLLHPPFAAGASGAGDGVGDAWVHVWTLEYMDNILAANPDEFEVWDNTDTVDDDFAQSPITMEQTADRLLMDVVAGDVAGSYIDLDAAPGDEVRVSMWVRTESGIKSFKLSILDCDGTVIDGVDTTVTPTWAKVEMQYRLSPGATTPQMQIYGLISETPRYIVSWAVAGIRNPRLEERAALLFPLNTVGEFHCKVENFAPEFLVDENGDLLFDDETGETLIDA
jgi:uncharacterized protein YmfQ (DUF2313 family)